MKYKTEEERREAQRLQARERYLMNREKRILKQREYRAEHRDEILLKHRAYNANHRDERRAYNEMHRKENNEQSKRFRNKPIGRADHLVNGYRYADVKLGRETSITREWIVDHVFSSSCVYCGESDWHKLGCDRKDNSIGHTPENCLPCCERCNKERGQKEFHQYVGSLWSIQGRLSQRGSAETR